MKSLNEVYANDTIFYWHNAIGEINIPGDVDVFVPSDIVHSPDELPPLCRQLYDRYCADSEYVIKYVVNYEGKTGVLLVSLHDEGVVNELCGIHPDERLPNEDESQKIGIAMQMYAFILNQRVAIAESDPVFANCTWLFGDYTDPVGHELALFVPAAEADRIPELEKRFLWACWNREDDKRLKKSAKILFGAGN